MTLQVSDWKSLPPAEAVNYFRSKGYAPSFDWQDIWQDEHAAAFAVAKMARLDLLQDVRAAVDKALAEGKTLAQFKKELTPILQEKGWWGKKQQIDPATGETRLVQLGSPRRLEIIYDTNLRTAHAAGRWEQIERSKATRPFLRYSATLDSRTRPAHRAWHGKILPVDDPSWSTHYPPNGWRCRCTVIQYSQAQLDSRGWSVSEPPKPRTVTYTNPRTGEVSQVPRGIDPGFGYNVGQSRLAALVPPPAGGLKTPFSGDPTHVPPPAARTVPASRLLPQGLRARDYIEAFMRAFGSTGRRTIFTDALGQDLVISPDLFKARTGVSKLLKNGRERYVLLLADTIRDPDEIWWQWSDNKGHPGLRRRYLRWVTLEGEDRALLAVVEVGRDGWVGVTAFNPERIGYLNGQRVGTLGYRRETGKSE